LFILKRDALMSERYTNPGRVLMVGLPGPTLDPTAAARLRHLGPGGVILFGRNLESAAQTETLLEEVRQLLAYPLLLALDQEGGRVSRLQPWVGATPAAAALARAGENAAFRFGSATAAALRALGFNLDFAPVVDLCAVDATNGIGDRSFGTDPERVTVLAGAFLDGLQDGGVAGCLKHFPGLGPTGVDSHERLPTATHSREQLDGSDLVPYRRLASRAATVMVGHGHYPALDPEADLPATLSFPVVTGLLRRDIGYRGLVVSDDLEMGAVAPLDADGHAAVRAVAAGCDLVLYCGGLDRAERAKAALARTARDDAGFERRLVQACRAVAAAATQRPVSYAGRGAWEAARRELAGFAGLC
jgi:beta-N-acetylhexosaminidase